MSVVNDVSMRAIASASSGNTASRTSGTREAEHTLGDDVPLDLARTTWNRCTEAAEVLDEPRALAPECRAEPIEIGLVEPERFGTEQQRVLERLAAVQLEQRVFR